MSLPEVEELKHLIECPSPIPLKDSKALHDKMLRVWRLFCTTKAATLAFFEVHPDAWYTDSAVVGRHYIYVADSY
jgi:hypothetical protein